MNGHAGVGAQSEVAGIVMREGGEACHIDADVVAIRWPPHAKLCAAARWDNAKLFRYREANNFCNLCSRAWFGNRRGYHLIHRIATQLFRGGNNVRGSEKPFQPGSENGGGDHEWTSCCGFCRVRISPQPLLIGKTLPGFSEESGLKASWMRR